jgi:hypothetical protein
MAGLGRRTFAPGEVLTASNVMNYLQDQVVQTYAGTAARGSAIGTAVSEGMVSYLADTNNIEVYDGAGWKQIASTTGSVLQVVSTTKTDVFSASLSAGSFSAITGLAATITPKSVSSKILVMVSVNGSYDVSGAGFGYAGFRLTLNGSAIDNFRGEAASNRGRTTAQNVSISSTNVMANSAFQGVHSPNSTSALTYAVEAHGQSASTITVYVNRTSGDTDATQIARTVSSITLLEIAG